MARKNAAPDVQISPDTYAQDFGYDSNVTGGDKDRQVALPNWTTPMAYALCKQLGTPDAAAQHIRAGVESVYQNSALGDGYIHGAGCDLTISAEEDQRRNDAKTDNGRIKMISSAESTLTPLLLAVYLLVANKMYGDELSGQEYQRRLQQAAFTLEEWYTKNARGAPLVVPIAMHTLEEAERFMSDSAGEWRLMEWYQKVPGGAPKPQPLQERDANSVMNDAPSKDDNTKKRGAKKASPPAASKKDENNVPSAADISTIHLPGEENEETPIFDTCDDIRKKLNEALKHTKQVQLARELDELLPISSLNSRQLGAFLKFKGPQAGAHTTAFYAAYVYFEKIRVKEDKKKMAKREKMEQKWRKLDLNKGWQQSGSRLGGFPRTGSHNAHLTCIQGERWRLDQYGEVQIYGQPKGGAILRKGPSKKPW
ncbi:hypothetical protein LTR85_011194 [Meristemomyces frigidus]|nr:hypothetical protein LTR85_011194 [Meristemomyces frigidus]